MNVETLRTRLAAIREKINGINVDDEAPGRTLSREIVKSKGNKTDPMDFNAFIDLYFAIVGLLDPNSLLRKMALAYLSLPNYSNEVVVQIGQYNGKVPYSTTREMKRDGFMRPWRYMHGDEISYKWAMAAILTTMPLMLKEAINVHDFASVITQRMQGKNCSVISKHDAFDRFVRGYQQKYTREYLAGGELTVEDLQGLMYKMILLKLGKHTWQKKVKTPADAASVDDESTQMPSTQTTPPQTTIITIESQNIPRDQPSWTNTYKTVRNDLDALKRRINQGFSTIVMRKQYDVAEALRKANESLKEQQRETPSPQPSECSSSCSSQSSASSSASKSHSYYSECTTCRDRTVQDEDFGMQNIDLTRTDSGSVINITITGGNVTINL